MIALMSLIRTAHAFCGTYVAVDTDMVNGASEIAVARQGTTTTLTMANDFQGDATEFAMLVPVPEILDEEDVHVVDPDVFMRLRGYSEPRQVTYTCEELYPEIPREPMGCGFSDKSEDSSDSGSWAGGETADSGGVTVEKQFIVGEYEIVVLSAQESTGLLGWLNTNGYSVSPKAQGMLQEYLDAGSYFFAAKVFTDRIPAGQDRLSPLQVSYESEAFSLPIRLGTVNSPGSQDLLLYLLTDPDAGRVGVSNYDEASVEADCLADTDDLASFYDQAFTEAVGEQPRWVVEYGWELNQWSLHCDPCTSVPGLPQDDVATLGFGDYGGSEDTGWGGSGWSEYYFTRLRMRYTPEQATQDLSLYTSGIRENTQQRYIQYESYLEAEFPICGQGFVDDPGSCADEGREYRKRMREADQPSSGCAMNGDAQGAVALMLFAGLGVLLRRGR